jgi:hypothetical protein
VDECVKLCQKFNNQNYHQNTFKVAYLYRQCVETSY